MCPFGGSTVNSLPLAKMNLDFSFLYDFKGRVPIIAMEVLPVGAVLPDRLGPPYHMDEDDTGGPGLIQGQSPGKGITKEGNTEDHGLGQDPERDHVSIEGHTRGQSPEKGHHIGGDHETQGQSPGKGHLTIIVVVTVEGLFLAAGEGESLRVGHNLQVILDRLPVSMREM